MADIEIEKLTPADRIVGDDAEDTGLLKAMLQHATDHLQKFQWCPPIDRTYLGCGVGGVVAVFLFHFRKPAGGTDEWLWVVVGDLPTAYFVPDGASGPASAIETYCGLMDEWARAVMEGRPLDDVFPVDAEATTANAGSLIKRLDFIRIKLLPGWRSKWPA